MPDKGVQATVNESADSIIDAETFRWQGVAKECRKEAEQVKTIKYELLGFGALLFLLFMALALPGGQDVRQKIRSPSELFMTSHVVPIQ